MPLLRDRKIISIYRKEGHGNILSSSNTELGRRQRAPCNQPGRFVTGFTA